MAYTLSLGDRFIKSHEIIARLDANVPLQLAHIVSIKEIEQNGCRYSYQDFDVLSAAYRAIGKSEVDKFNAKWVEHMCAKADLAKA